MTGTQTDLWEPRPNWPGIRPARTIGERYVEWRATRHGREVYEAVVTLALRAHGAGVARYGIKAICEVVRWERMLASGRDEEGFKVNNSYTALMAREIMQGHPTLRRFFETRRRLVD